MVGIWAYCFMTNHVHLIEVPKEIDSFARCFSDAHIKYTRCINIMEGWNGLLWQSRFGSNILDEKHLIAVVRYVERNPVRAGLFIQHEAILGQVQHNIWRRLKQIPS